MRRMNGIPYKIYLSEQELPRKWYNLKAVMKELPPPPLHPATLKPCTAEDLKPIFCDKLVEQETNTTDKYIEIPEGLFSFYKMIRPSPLIRAFSDISLYKNTCSVLK
jgi:tryptophan synthase beta chain